MYGVELRKELVLRVETLAKAAETEDPASARRVILETLWLERLDFKTAVEDEARQFGYS